MDRYESRADTVVVALGGNAILQAGQRGTAAEQMANVRTTAFEIANLVAAGWRVVVTHGNGPQVGNILLQNEEAQHTVPPMPLDICGAESQGMLGYMIAQALGSALAARGVPRPVAAIITQVMVDPHDPAFSNPTKPVGRFYPEEEAERLKTERGWTMKKTDKGWRRVVASPDPLAIVEAAAIERLVDAGVVVVASGGGGVPVVVRDGTLVGVEGVIDKDLAGQRLAADVRAGYFLILTDVPRVKLFYGQPNEMELAQLTVSEAKAYLAAGHFGVGSMAPKIQAAIRFLEAGGREAVIAALGAGIAALEGRAGTRIVPDESNG